MGYQCNAEELSAAQVRDLLSQSSSDDNVSSESSDDSDSSETSTDTVVAGGGRGQSYDATGNRQDDNTTSRGCGVSRGRSRGRS